MEKNFFNQVAELDFTGVLQIIRISSLMHSVCMH